MALGSFIAGAYSATYDPPGGVAAADMGVMEDGYEVSVRVAKELIDQTDKYGRMIIDAVYQGLAEFLIQANGIEWKAGMLAACFPYGAAIPASGSGYFGPGVIARLDSAVAGVIILTAASSTPAAVAPASLTATYACITERAVRWIKSSRLRKLPGEWRCYPYDDAGTCKIVTFT